MNPVTLLRRILPPAGLTSLLLVTFMLQATPSDPLNTPKDPQAKSPRFFQSGMIDSRLDKLTECYEYDKFTCLSIGDIVIGSNYTELLKTLGEPWQEFHRPAGTIDSVFPIRIQQNRSAYWVISHKEARITAIQLTGNSTPEPLDFVGLQLGDRRERVVEKFGKPKYRRRYGQSETYLWDYSPLPLTIEISNDRLVSIRTFLPDSVVSQTEVNEQIQEALTGMANSENTDPLANPFSDPFSTVGKIIEPEESTHKQH